VLVTRRTCDECLAPFVGARRLICDVETNGTHPWLGHRVIGVALALPSLEHVCYFPIRHEPGGNLRWEQYRRLISLLSQRDVVYTGWNYKFDLEMLLQDGMRFPRTIEDIMLAAHYLNENDQPFELKRWGVKYLRAEAADAEAEMLALIKERLKELGLKAKKKELKGKMALLHPEELEPYACDDVRITEGLRRLMIPALKTWDLLGHWRDANDYLRIVARMEIRGLQLDVPRIHVNIAEAEQESKKAYALLVKKAGFEINPGSPAQIREWLKISSSAAPILEEMQTDESEAILAYRAWEKANGTYYRRWLEWMDADQVLHPNLNLHRVVTGRQSASDPNLHAVPRYRAEYKVKDVIVARKGYVLISADYNQAELRMGVSVAQEENMAKLFLSKPPKGKKTVDIHQLVADQLHIERDPAKTINFMILYGGGAEKLARKLKIDLRVAKEYLRRYHIEYWHFRHTSNFWANRARYQGYIRLWNGRIRHFNHPRANPKDAFNSLVQGGVAAMLEDAILALDPILRPEDVHMMLQIHDQIILECPKALVDDAVPIVIREMENFHHFLIPPKVDVKVGRRWGQLEDYEVAA
jgi:DNA polymerase-1